MAFYDINLDDSGDMDNAVISNPLHLFFQEIQLSVTVGPQEIWGCKSNIELNKYLFNQYITVNNIKNEITEYISKNCSQAEIFQYTIEVQLLNVDNKELIYITVRVYSEDEDKEFVQKFLLGT